MRITRISGLSSELEVDSFSLADGRKTLEHRDYPLCAELGVIELGLVNANFGRVGVEIIWFPGDIECVAGVGGRELGDGPVEFPVANITPGTHSILIEI